MWEIYYTKQAITDSKRIIESGLTEKAKHLISMLKENPYQNPPPYEKLIGYLSGVYSRRITIQHRLIYQIYSDEHVVKIIRMWTHYE